jgi:hypothetical protein
MKYEIYLHKTETKTISYDSVESIERAAETAMIAYPGFKVDAVEEFDDEGVWRSHEVVGRCEACGLFLFSESKYVLAGDDGCDARLCLECATDLDADELCDE